jgi:hypothetical protein
MSMMIFIIIIGGYNWRTAEGGSDGVAVGVADGRFVVGGLDERNYEAARTSGRGHRPGTGRQGGCSPLEAKRTRETTKSIRSGERPERKSRAPRAALTGTNDRNKRHE